MSTAHAVPVHRSGVARTRTHHARPSARPPHRAAVRSQPSRPEVGHAGWLMSAVLAALVLAGGLEALAGGASEPAQASVATPAGGGAVVARPGDTLWSIAAEHRGDVPIRRYVDALIDRNGGPSIVAGQRVQLP